MSEQTGNLEFRTVNLRGAISFIQEVATDDKGNAFFRKKGSSVIYRQIENNGYNQCRYACVTCGSEIMSATVAHSVRDGLFPLSGSGRCKNEEVPYCPECEKEPEFHGFPIQEDSPF